MSGRSSCYFARTGVCRCTNFLDCTLRNPEQIEAEPPSFPLFAGLFFGGAALAVLAGWLIPKLF